MKDTRVTPRDIQQMKIGKRRLRKALHVIPNDIASHVLAVAYAKKCRQLNISRHVAIAILDGVFDNEEKKDEDEKA